MRARLRFQQSGHPSKPYDVFRASLSHLLEWVLRGSGSDLSSPGTLHRTCVFCFITYVKGQSLSLYLSMGSQGQPKAQAQLSAIWAPFKTVWFSLRFLYHICSNPACEVEVQISVIWAHFKTVWSLYLSISLSLYLSISLSLYGFSGPAKCPGSDFSNLGTLQNRMIFLMVSSSHLLESSL